MRIQVLNLPDEVVDGQEVPRFALICDEYGGPFRVPGGPEHHEAAATFRAFAQACGAKDGLVVDRRVEIVESTLPQEFLAEVVTQLDDMIGRRLDEHAAARERETHHWHFKEAALDHGTFLKAFAARRRAQEL